MLNTSREALYRIFMLSYAYRTTGELKFAERAEKKCCTWPDMIIGTLNIFGCSGNDYGFVYWL